MFAPPELVLSVRLSTLIVTATWLKLPVSVIAELIVTVAGLLVPV
jgi:hypothetical protein